MTSSVDMMPLSWSKHRPIKITMVRCCGVYFIIESMLYMWASASMSN